MKRLIALLLTLVLVFPVLSQLCIAAEAADKKKDTAKEKEKAMLYVPLMETLEDADLVSVEVDDEENIYLVYMPADMDTLDYLMYLYSICGIYGRETVIKDKNLMVYELCVPGTDYSGLAYLDKKDKSLIVKAPGEIEGLTQEEMEEELEYYEQEISFPAKFGKNVFPQFFASVGKSQPMGNMVSKIDYVFDGAKCWMEMYSDISYPTLQKYIREMILCGFSVEITNGAKSEDNELITTIFHFDNGDAEVIVRYDSEDGDVCVYYEPGVTYYLLSGKEYKKYIPQK